MIYVVDQGGTIDFMDYCIYTRGKGSDAMNSDNAANLYAALDLILQGTGRSYEDAGEACANAVDVFSSNIALLMTEQSDPSLLTGDNAETLEPQGAAEHEMELPRQILNSNGQCGGNQEDQGHKLCLLPGKGGLLLCLLFEFTAILIQNGILLSSC